jgi:hypothetical protein
MVATRIDGVGHAAQARPVSSLAASAVSTTTAGTIAGTTAAGAAPTVAIPSGFVCNDRAGTFELTAVTGGGAQAAGDVATVRFANEYAATPSAVLVQLYDITANPDAVRACAATAVTTQGFNINVAAALTTATVYRVSYHVIPGGSNAL